MAYYSRGSVEERFWSKVNKRVDNECWEWNTYLTDGYGKLWVDKKMVHSHRVSWIIHFGEIPNGFHVLHKCDNRACVNPNHLFLGTNNDNVKDRNAKQRQSKGTRNRHKLSENDVYEIRRLYDTGKVCKTLLKKMFCISYSQVYMILSRGSWAWLK